MVSGQIHMAKHRSQTQMVKHKSNTVYASPLLLPHDLAGLLEVLTSSLLNSMPTRPDTRAPEGILTEDSSFCSANGWSGQCVLLLLLLPVTWLGRIFKYCNDSGQSHQCCQVNSLHFVMQQCFTNDHKTNQGVTLAVPLLLLLLLLLAMTEVA